MALGQRLSVFFGRIQAELFPFLREELGAMTPRHERLARVMESVNIPEFLPYLRGRVGRPEHGRAALAHAFLARVVLQIGTVRGLIERLQADSILRRLCGFASVQEIPSESTFSRAFAEFSRSSLPEKIHAALIAETYKDTLVGHVSRDSTAIEAREKPDRSARYEDSESQEPSPKRPRGRPPKGTIIPPKPERRLEKQGRQSLEDMLADLPTVCNHGSKKNAKGHVTHWIGYKLHVDTIDNDIPVSCLLTSASLHDSQAALPLAIMTAARITSCYDLMDSAYDCPEIEAHSRSLGHVPIIDENPRADKARQQALKNEAKALETLSFSYPEDQRYHQRSSAERLNSALKDSYGARLIYVKGHAKVFCHLMFGVLVHTAEQLHRLVT